MDREKIKQALEACFNQYPGVAFDRLILLTLAARELGATTRNYHILLQGIGDYLDEQIQAGTYLETKGRDGGITRLVIPQVELATMPIKAKNNSPPVNNHTCPHCRNEKCNTDERSCWKCGGSLH